MSAPVALYIHFPFCLSICPYCDFVVYGGSAARGPANRIASTVGAMATEIRLRATAQPMAALRSVYFGGGTPSLLTPDQAGLLLEATAEAFGIAADAEITLECNPGPADRGDLAGLRAAGVNRLSVGAQSFDPLELRTLGRRHSPADIADTIVAARRAGLDNISLDLLYDIPGQTLDSWRRTLASAIALAPEHLSAYALTLDDPDIEGLTGALGDHLPLRAGARRWRQASLGGQDERLAADCYALADDMLAEAGLDWYEISNWARPGHQSRHNLAYWTGAAWEAVGPGAHAFDGARRRRWNAARLDAYIAALEVSELPPESEEVTSAEVAAAESAILSLRTAAGMRPSQAENPAFRSAVAWGLARRMLEPSGSGGVRLTRRGRLLADELFVRLLPEPSAAVAA